MNKWRVGRVVVAGGVCHWSSSHLQCTSALTCPPALPLIRVGLLCECKRRLSLWLSNRRTVKTTFLIGVHKTCLWVKIVATLRNWNPTFFLYVACTEVMLQSHDCSCTLTFFYLLHSPLSLEINQVEWKRNSWYFIHIQHLI